MGLIVAKYAFKVVPSLTLVRDTLAERMQRPVELLESPPGFGVTVWRDGGPPGVVRSGTGFNLTPRERALDVEGFIGWNPDKPEYASPEYKLLSRALTELGGRPAEVELELELGRNDYRQRFDFEGKVPEPLEVHARIIALGGATRSDRPPEVYASGFELSVPGLLPGVFSISISVDPEEGEITLIAGIRPSIIDEAAEALEALGGQPVEGY